MNHDATPAVLPATLDLTAAEALREQLLDACSRPGDVPVDAAAVDTITSPCIQVLLAASRSLTDQGRRMIVTDPSPSFDAAFADLGLGTFLHDWSDNK